MTSSSRHTFVDPPGRPPASYSHVAIAAPGRTIYVAGQVAEDASGAIVGIGDLAAQTRRALVNLEEALAAAGASLRDIVKLGWYVTDLRELPALRAARDAVLGDHKPTSTLVQVSGLYRPGLLVEVEAVAVAPA